MHSSNSSTDYPVIFIHLSICLMSVTIHSKYFHHIFLSKNTFHGISWMCKNVQVGSKLGSKSFMKVSNRFMKVQEVWRWSMKVQEVARWFKNVQGSWRLKEVWKGSKRFKNLQDGPRRFQNCSRRIEKIQEVPRRFKKLE